MTALRTPHLSSFILSAVGAVISGCGGTAADDAGGPQNNSDLEDTTRNAPQTLIDRTDVSDPNLNDVTPEERTPVSANLCVTKSDSDDPSEVAGLNPELQLDYLASFTWSTNQSDADPQLRILEEAGKPCTVAADPEACRQELNGMLETPGAYSGVILTGESGPILLTDDDDIVSYLGKIDTFNEANYILRANLSWPLPTCDDIEKTSTGYEYQYEEEDCNGTGTTGDTVTLLGTVAPDGSFSTTEISRTQSNRGCPVPGRLTSGQGCGGNLNTASNLASYMKMTCHFETAAVGAFMRLAAELKKHGAPDTIVQGATRAAAEEIEHALVTRVVCAELGVQPDPVRSQGSELRSLFEVAKENAGEGCVRELYAAAVAHFQSKRAANPALRRMWSKIAEEETGHAQWSLELHAWMKTQLNEAEWTEVEAVRVRAREQLASTLEEPCEELVREAGLPTRAQAQQLLNEIAPLLAA